MQMKVTIRVRDKNLDEFKVCYQVLSTYKGTAGEDDSEDDQHIKQKCLSLTLSTHNIYGII